MREQRVGCFLPAPRQIGAPTTPDYPQRRANQGPLRIRNIIPVCQQTDLIIKCDNCTAVFVGQTTHNPLAGRYGICQFLTTHRATTVNHQPDIEGQPWALRLG